MEYKKLSEIASYMESLGIIDKGYLDKLLEDVDLQGFAGAMCVTHKKYEDKKVGYAFNIIKEWDTNLYHVKEYKARMLNVPAIEHQIFQDIDTSKLEHKLSINDWNITTLPLHKDDRELSDTFYDLVRLARMENLLARDIAEKLMIKYWADTPLERILGLSTTLEKYEKVLNFPLKMELNDVDDLQAFNILSGRSVMKFHNQEGQNADGYWLKEKNGKLITLPDFNLSEKMRDLPLLSPFDEVTGPEAVLELIVGKRIALPLKIGKDVTPAFIEADPENGGLLVYDMDMKKMDLSQRINENRHRQKNIKAVSRKPRKGRSL